MVTLGQSGYRQRLVRETSVMVSSLEGGYFPIGWTNCLCKHTELGANSRTSDIQIWKHLPSNRAKMVWVPDAAQRRARESGIVFVGFKHLKEIIPAVTEVPEIMIEYHGA